MLLNTNLRMMGWIWLAVRHFDFSVLAVACFLRWKIFLLYFFCLCNGCNLLLLVRQLSSKNCQRMPFPSNSYKMTIAKIEPKQFKSLLAIVINFSINRFNLTKLNLLLKKKKYPNSSIQNS